jgi:hypothetical protein
MHTVHGHKHEVLRTTLWRSLYEAGTLMITILFLLAVCLLVVYSL